MDKGWIKLYRQIQDNALWISDSPFDVRSAWIDLIMMANVDTKTILYKGQTITINRGEVYTSIRKLAERWHWSTGKVTRFITILSKLDMVKKKKNVKCATLLSLVNYDDFQSVRNSNRDSDKHSGRYSNRDSDGVLLKNIKNDKEIKNSSLASSVEEPAAEEEIVGLTDEEWDALGDDI